MGSIVPQIFLLFSQPNNIDVGSLYIHRTLDRTHARTLGQEEIAAQAGKNKVSK